MNFTSLSFALVAMLLAQSSSVRAIDTMRSRASFSVTHIWVEHVTGSVPILEGSATFDGASAIPGRVSAVLDATKISTGEPDRDRSLESPDFFDTTKFPTWTFFSTKITPKGTTLFEMDGDLTIHGVTQPEHVNVAVGGDAAHPIYHATARIDRHAFSMPLTRLDPTIGSTADVVLEIVFK